MAIFIAHLISVLFSLQRNIFLCWNKKTIQQNSGRNSVKNLTSKWFHSAKSGFWHFYVYHQQQNKCYRKGVYLPISKLHSILGVENILAHNNITISYYVLISKVASDKSNLRNGQVNTFGGSIYFAVIGTWATFSDFFFFFDEELDWLKATPEGITITTIRVGQYLNTLDTYWNWTSWNWHLLNPIYDDNNNNHQTNCSK